MTTAKMLTETVTDKRAWTRADLKPTDWTVELTPDSLAELRIVLAELRRSPLPIFALDPADYEMEACRALMARVREVTQNGTMFAVLDRLPMDEMTREESFKLFWLISGLLARPVAQKFNGQLYFDVNDTGLSFFLLRGRDLRATIAVVIVEVVAAVVVVVVEAAVAVVADVVAVEGRLVPHTFHISVSREIKCSSSLTIW